MLDFDSLLSEAAQLSVDQKLRLIDELAASVPDDQPPSLSAEWVTEIEKRSAELDSGEEKPVSWETVRQTIRRKVGLDREY